MDHSRLFSSWSIAVAAVFSIGSFQTLSAQTGSVQVCKVAGAGVAVGTNFSFNVGGTPVVIPAGATAGSSCSTALILPVGQAAITETVPAGTALTSVSTSPQGALVSSNLAAGTATVTVTAGALTTATFTNASTMGTIQVCKVAGSGISVGTNFTFNVGGTPVTIPAGASPGSSCSTAMAVPAGQVGITETVPAGTALTSVSTSPPGALAGSNLGAGMATVTVTAGALTTATFTNASLGSGSVQVCKVAGSGIAAGTNFTFNVGGTSVVVPAGATPGSSCSAAVVLPAGQAGITETLPSGTLLTSVSTSPPGALVSSNLAAGMATVTVTAGALTTATFTNAGTTGTIRVCKVAGSGIAAGTNFTFNVGGTPAVVPAGACSAAIAAPAGQVGITEALPSGNFLTSVSTAPPGALVSSNLAAGTATVTVTAGALTTATFTNAGTAGTIQICKVAGSGIAAGTNFTFSVGGTSVIVAAGATPGSSCSTALVAPAGPVGITETLPSGTLLTSVSTAPPGALASSNLAAGTATVTVTAGALTIATFTNTGTSGTVQICKVAGPGIAAGTNFTFSVGGTSVVVAAGATPGSSCSSAIVAPAGSVGITETLPSGTLLTSVSTSPSSALAGSNLSAGTATVTVTAGGQTTANFTNSRVPPPTPVPSSFILVLIGLAGAGIYSWRRRGWQAKTPAPLD